MREILDAIDWWVTLLASVAVFGVFFELGFRHGRRRRDRVDPDEKAQVNTIVTALLALVGLLLAFTFSIVEARYQARKTLVIEDANTIRTAFLRAATIPEPHGAAVKDLLREYVTARLTVTPDNAKGKLQQFEKLHHALWTHANTVANQHPNSELVALFVESINDVINLHETRLATIVHHRLPLTIMGALFLVSLLAMGGLGHSSGLTRSRSTVPTFVIVLAIAVVEVLIVDLDRPVTGLFRISQAAMVDVKDTMSRW